MARVSYGEWQEVRKIGEIERLLIADITKATDQHDGVSPLRWRVDDATLNALMAENPEMSEGYVMVLGIPIFGA